MSIEWKVEKRKVADLKTWEKNPRKITEEAFNKLKSRIEKRGFHDVIKLDTENNILSGNQRKRALSELGIEEVDCKIPLRELTDNEKKEICLESNRNDGVWDFDMLGNEFDMVMLTDVGFTEKELGFDFGNKDIEEDEVPEPPVEPKSKLGDIYQLGRHRVMCGDATKESDVAKLMDGKQADMVFTDPPYNVDYTGGANGDKGFGMREGIENDKMSDEDFAKFMDESIGNMLKFCNGVFYICMSSKELANLKNAFESRGGALAELLDLGEKYIYFKSSRLSKSI